MFLKNSQISIFMKVRLVGAELLHADGRTDRQTAMTKIIVAFRNLAYAPKKFCINVVVNSRDSGVVVPGPKI